MYNEPSHRAACRNRFLRMFRTELRSRCRLVPRQAHRYCKPSLAYQGGYVDGGHGESHVRAGKARTCLQQLQVFITPKGSGLCVYRKWPNKMEPVRPAPKVLITLLQLSRSFRTLTRKTPCHLVLHNAARGSCLRVLAHQSPDQTVIAPQIPSRPPIHKPPVAVVVVVTSPSFTQFYPP